MNSNSKQCKFLSFIVIVITLAVSSVYYKINKPNAYEIRVEDKVVAYVKVDNSIFSKIKALGDEVEKRFKTSKLKDSIAVYKSTVTEDYFIDEKLLDKAIIQNSGIQIDALSMLCDGKEIAIVANESEGKQALNKVANYYADKSGLKVKESRVKNKITYSKKKVMLSEVDTVDRVSERIKDVNLKSNKPVVTIEITGTVESKVTALPRTIVQPTNDLPLGQTKVQSEGKNGQKTVVKQITMENSKIISSKIISEKITVAPKDKIVLKGTKSAAAVNSTLLASPSRGTISSGFGMRWGRMHEGLDIAADLGTPIYAALDGTVTYSGWATGYGMLIKLKHKDGLETYYGHCSKLLVSEGQTVKKGDKIGEVGSTGNSTGPHLHFEVRVNGIPKDPAPYLKSIKGS
ncbi:peptidoglycan DD-metalloendopeptidase family protein [Clostridium sp. SYSU_GA19001]|uniref:M23 family metallopeptidase n=1 Tax=Clostridium caldaquaticum TaxID=2940653 RepID=UPI0020778FD6|nr:peptidoglycan DD-metalloendopeptidase family protein [Clostridium caldaquaticum]MCM8711569.1 peptidoglycan DD-metalloendopeptidase family protein [Clostridium caldaquaticum]